MGKCLLSQGLSKEAFEVLYEVRSLLNGETEKVLFAQAALSENPKLAFEALQDVLPKSKSGKTWALAGDIACALERYPQAVDYYRNALRFGHNPHQVQLHLAHALRKCGFVEEAIAIFRDILKRDPEDVQATIGFACALQTKGEPHKALSALRTSAAWIKNDPLLTFQTGLIALYLRRDSLAEECFSLAREKGDFPEAYLFHGYSLEKSKRWEEAEKIYLEMVKVFPEDARGYEAAGFLFAVGLSSSISADQGILIARTLHKLKPNRTSSELLSACEARVGNFEIALKIQESLIALDLDKKDQIRRRQCLRALKRNLPLDDTLVPRLVA